MAVRRKIIATLLIVTAATSFMFATGAAVVGGPADTLAEDRLSIQPADGPQGDYTYLNEDNEIVIDISAGNPNLPNDFKGVTPDTLGAVDSVFTITYTADESARIWITHPEENVTFVADGDSIEGEDNNVTLGPNESTSVGLRVDTRDEPTGINIGGNEFNINAVVVDPEGDSPDTGSTGRDSDASTADDDTPTGNDEDLDPPEPESNTSASGDSTSRTDDATVEPSEPVFGTSTSNDDTPADTDTNATTEDDTTNTPGLELAGIGLYEIGGLTLLVVFVVATVALSRRMS